MSRSFKYIPILLALIAAFQLGSCKEDDDSKSKCEEVICTLEFVTISVSVTDQNQNPVALDSFEVKDVANGEIFTLELTASEITEAQQSGRYPLVNDGSLGVNQERQLRFTGFQNNQEVIRGDYTVATDCCHIGLVEGDTELSLQ